MNPDLEVVQIGRGESFTAWEHGYPFRTVRWHFHPEYEIHHVVATTGQYFVGDFIGEFNMKSGSRKNVTYSRATRSATRRRGR